MRILLFKLIQILWNLTDGFLTWYAKLGMKVHETLQRRNNGSVLKKKRAIIGIVAISLGMFYALNYTFSHVIDWYGIICNVLYIAMILFWVFASDYHGSVLKDQEKYFACNRYSETYQKYKNWMGYEGDIHIVSKIYYGLWVIISALLLYYGLSLKIYRTDGLLRILNIILLILILFLSGNSVFSTAVFTYFLCDIFNNERIADRNNDSSLPFNVVRPGQTVGLQRLLIDTRMYSSSFLLFALCYVLSFSIQVWEYMHLNEMDSLNLLLNNKYFQIIVVFIVLICVAMYIVSTIGARYFLKKLLEIWILKQKTTIQNMTYTDQQASEIDNKLDALEKDKIPPFPSMLEIVITTLLGGLVSSLLNVVFK